MLDYGSGNLRSAERALRRVGADVTVTADRQAAMEADGLVVRASGRSPPAWPACARCDGPSIIDRRLAGGRPVLGICVGNQVLFERGVECDERTEGCGRVAGHRRAAQGGRPAAHGLEHGARAGGVDAVRRRGRRHALLLRALFGVRRWELEVSTAMRPPLVTWATTARTSSPRSRTVRCRATQFHPEKSGDAGARVL